MPTSSSAPAHPNDTAWLHDQLKRALAASIRRTEARTYSDEGQSGQLHLSNVFFQNIGEQLAQQPTQEARTRMWGQIQAAFNAVYREPTGHLFKAPEDLSHGTHELRLYSPRLEALLGLYQHCQLQLAG